MKHFPHNFLWGAATSAHQVEGNNHNDWSEWEKLGRVRHGERSGRASGHYERFHQDFALAKQLGHNAHRLSVEWSRIEPRPGVINEDALKHYKEVLTSLHQLGIQPIVTLWHFTNPIWIRDRGGWTNRRTVDAFARFVELVVDQLGAQVPYWITINEPTVYTSLGYISGYWPPQRKNFLASGSAIRNFVTAHRLASQIIHRRFPHAKVGVANNLNHFAPLRPDNLLDRGLTWFSQYWHNRWFLDQTYAQVDFIGLNYYFYHPVKFKISGIERLFSPAPMPHLPTTDLGWTIYPKGLGLVMESLRAYQLPIIITENGLADAEDSRRAGYIRDHIAQVSQALASGLDVRGYIYWSLIDNFEWREGFDPRFGLIEIDYANLERRVRPSAYAFRDIIQRGLGA